MSEKYNTLSTTLIFGNNTTKEKTPREAVTNLSDKQWLESVAAIVDANYADANFGVEEFSKYLRENDK